jgi:hypothetical protein
LQTSGETWAWSTQTEHRACRQSRQPKIASTISAVQQYSMAKDNTCNMQTMVAAAAAVAAARRQADYSPVIVHKVAVRHQGEALAVAVLQLRRSHHLVCVATMTSGGSSSSSNRRRMSQRRRVRRGVTQASCNKLNRPSRARAWLALSLYFSLVALLTSLGSWQTHMP